jgi:hypothetical protein
LLATTRETQALKFGLLADPIGSVALIRGFTC